jgi:hypothetical protein
LERIALARSSWIVIFDLANKAIAWPSSSWASAFLPDFANKRASIPFAEPSKGRASSRAACVDGPLELNDGVRHGGGTLQVQNAGFGKKRQGLDPLISFLPGGEYDWMTILGRCGGC